MHGFIYIILKESLKNIPIIGWSCQFYNFIFLARNWEEDKQRFQKALSKLNKPDHPMWLIIFPEGTNLSETTREKSAKWAQKNGLKDMKHQLLPRSTGLGFCLQQLQDTTEWLYDCTIAYEGVPEGQFGQDIFTLRSSFFEGRPPKSVNMHWRRFRIDSIPIHNSKAFEVWLRNRWREKDYMLEYFSKNHRFPADDFWKHQLDTKDNSSTGSYSIRSVPRGARTIETEVKSGNWNEFIKIFAPITSVFAALSLAYGATPKDLPIPGGTAMFEKVMKGILSGGEMKGLPSPEELEKMIEGAAGLGAGQSSKSDDQGKAQQLTKENLAKLVKETAIKNGIGLPRKPRPHTTLPPSRKAPTMVNKSLGPKAKSAIHSTAAVKKITPQSAQPTAKPKQAQTGETQTILTKSGVAIKVPKPQAAKGKETGTGESQTVLTKSGVAIKIPKTQVEEAKNTGTVVTKSGLVLKVTKKEIEEAQKKKGSTLVTSSGVPIKVTPSGAMTFETKSAGPAKTPSQAKTVKSVVNGTPKKATTGAQKKSAVGSGSTASKPPPKLNGALPKVTSGLPKAQPPKLTTKK
jgi:hypothetical protein